MAKGRPLILLVEDELPLRRYLRATLLSNGYRVKEADTGQEGYAMVARFNPDVVLLDLDLARPGLDGLALVQDVRERSRVPIIVVSARGREEYKVRALDVGVDDYLTKPFGSEELLARIRVALRHSVIGEGIATGLPVEIGPLKVDLVNQEITLDGVEVHLTPNEFTLLAILVIHAGKVVTHRQLLEGILGAKAPTQPNTLLRTYLANLRKKLEPDPAKPHLLITKPRLGYRLDVPHRSEGVELPALRKQVFVLSHSLKGSAK